MAWVAGGKEMLVAHKGDSKVGWLTCDALSCSLCTVEMSYETARDGADR